MTAKTPVPVTLTGRHVRLEPLTMAHLPDLFASGGVDEEVWRLVPGPIPRTEADLGKKLQDLLGKAAAGECVPFAVILLASGRAVGWTTFFDIAPKDEWLEIGYT